MRALFAFVLAALVLPATAQSVNFSGKWALSGGGGRGGQNILTLNQVGGAVFGSLGSASGNQSSGAPRGQEILDGKVSGNEISFYIWTGNDVPAKQMYKGRLSGEEIVFEITGGPSRGGGGGFGGRGATAAPTGPPTAHRVK